MIFAAPQYFWLFCFIPLVFLPLLFHKHKGIQAPVLLDLIQAQGVPWGKVLEYGRYILIMLILSMAIIIVARPQSEHSFQSSSKKGIDIILSLDVSESMLSEDLSPSRMEAAKNTIMSFLESRKEDRVGLIIFSGLAFTQSPLTFDYLALKEIVEKVSIDSINQNVQGLSGTAIGDAILSAAQRLKKSENREKIIIVFTDGDSNSGIDPVLAAKKAKEEGIKVFTVGIGKVGGAPIPIRDQFGNTQYARNPDGSVFLATFNEDTLKEISRITGGAYYRASDNESLQSILAKIDSLQKHEILQKKTVYYQEQYRIFLYPLLVFMFFFIISNHYRLPE